MKKLILTLFFCLIASLSFAQNYYYLSQWEWYAERPDFPYWRCPGGNCVSLIDLRSIPQMSKLGGAPEGFGFFVYNNSQTIPDSIYLGNDLNKVLSAKNKNQIQTTLNLILDKNILLDILWELLTVKSDPTGQTRWKPLRGLPNKEIELHIAGQTFKKISNDIDINNTIAVFQADYRRNKVAGFPLKSLKKWTGSEMKKIWGRMDNNLASQLLPPEYIEDSWSNPQTTIGDTFVETTDTGLNSHTATGPNGGFSWTYTSGSFTVIAATDDVDSATTSSHNNARAGSSLSSDAHYSQANIWLPSGTARDVGVATRFAAAANTMYIGIYDSATSQWFIYSVVNGSYTSLGSFSEVISINGELLYLESDSSDIHTLKFNGIQKIQVTNTAITGNLRCGIRSYSSFSTLDNFEAKDLTVVTTIPSLIINGTVFIQNMIVQ